RLMRPFVNHPGVRLVNAVKHHTSRISSGRSYRQSHAAFAFLLDYVPDWRLAYAPGGLIQYQSFIPAERAATVLGAQLDLCRKRGHLPYLAVLKRHRPDAFLMTHALDGFSLALDFPVTGGGAKSLWALTADLDRMVVEAGGRFYFAKDSTLSHAGLGPYLEEERVRRFLALKRECDPEGLLETDLYRRIFPG
ncbi:MAG TPA: FAD-binding protein, partial [Vicinamibacteria bacterium]|nr:FAD-binding protein [Vicinamibacteria bacterium]